MDMCQDILSGKGFQQFRGNVEVADLGSIFCQFPKSYGDVAVGILSLRMKGHELFPVHFFVWTQHGFEGVLLGICLRLFIVSPQVRSTPGVAFLPLPETPFSSAESCAHFPV